MPARTNISGGGKRFVEVTDVTPTNGQISVSGLPFRPKYIIVEQNYSTKYYVASYCADAMSFLLNNVRGQYEGSYGGGQISTGFIIYDDAFTVTLINLGVSFNYKCRIFE